MNADLVVVGSGFFGLTIAERCANELGLKVLVLERRHHLGGNAYSEVDPETGIEVHVYGAHLFHTSNQRVWDYVNRFTSFTGYQHRVFAKYQGQVYSFPMNLGLINQFFGKTFRPAEAEAFIQSLGDKSIENPATFEEQALRFVGRELYEAFFTTYTLKQWGLHPSELPASILKRLPVRFNYDDNYFNHKYQGMPANGYTALVENVLKVPGITVHLGTRFDPAAKSDYDHVFYSGPIDGRLGPVTSAAYAKYQASRGKVADGFITLQSWRELTGN